jgi:hypothetical protein
MKSSFLGFNDAGLIVAKACRSRADYAVWEITTDERVTYFRSTDGLEGLAEFGRAGATTYGDKGFADRIPARLQEKPK